VSALPIRRFREYVGAITRQRLFPTIWYVDRLRSSLLDLAAVRFVVVPRARASAPELANDPALPPIYADEQVAIFENRAAFARARIVHEANPVAGEGVARTRLRRLAAQPAHARELGRADRAFVEPDASGSAPPAPGAGPASGESVRIVDASDPDRLVLEAELRTPGFVVVADTYYPGWTASVDGRPAAIHPADLLFRAVFVEPGSHRIVLRYRPLAFFAGVALCALAGALCLLLVVRAGRARSGAVDTPSARPA
jgi:hypothetical protein